MRNYYWSKLFLIFIPEKEKKTLAEMSFNEYQRWQEKRFPDSFAYKFAQWFLRNK